MRRKKKMKRGGEGRGDEDGKEEKKRRKRKEEGRERREEEKKRKRRGNEASLFWAGMAVVCCYGLLGSWLYHCGLLCARSCWRYQKVTIAEIGDDSNCWPVFYQSYSRDWLAVVCVYLSAILLDLSASVSRLLLSSRIETRC